MKIVYDRETCGRCGGSGHYSYNQMHGTTCYGCGGAGTKLTRAGKRARARIEAWKDEHATVLARDVKVGDRIEYAFGGRRFHSVLAVGGPPSAWSIHEIDGVEYWFPSYPIVVKGCSIGFAEDSPVRLAVGGERFEKLVAFARTLKSGVTIEGDAS